MTERMPFSPPTKKAKYDEYNVEPGVLSGAKSASALAKGEDGDEAFDIAAVSLDRFFPKPTTVQNGESLAAAIRREANDQVADLAKGVMTTLRVALNENMYRNGIYRQLTGKKYNLETVPGTRKRLSYNEMDLIELFETYVERNKDHISTEERDELFRKMHDKDHWLKLTTTSKPDLSFLRHVNGVVEFVLGEIKDDSIHSPTNAEQQDACYLQGLLYFLRVKLGLPVITLYGFAVCGTKCSGINSTFIHPKYAVGLVKLSAPQTLKGRFVVESCWEEFGAFDSLGLKILIHFLKRGYSYEYERLGESVWEPRRDLQVRCPSLFTLPPWLWEDTDERKLVVNGTLAAVFRVHTLDAARELLDSIVPVDEPDLIQKNQGQLVKIALDELDFGPGFIYIKIHTTETIQTLDTSMFNNIWNALKRSHRSVAISDFFQTYPVEPPNFSKCSFIVMYNRGESLNHVNLTTRYANFSCARPKLLALKSNVEELEQFCFHGDILPHNVAVDKEGKLTLFDYDEALRADTKPQWRNIPNQENIYCRLSYPNALRKDNKKEYSAIQFSLIVRFVAEKLRCSNSELTSVERLTSCHETVADLLDFDERKVKVSEEKLSQILLHVRELVQFVDAILAEEMEGERMEDEGETSVDGS